VLRYTRREGITEAPTEGRPRVTRAPTIIPATMGQSWWGGPLLTGKKSRTQLTRNRTTLAEGGKRVE